MPVIRSDSGTCFFNLDGRVVVEYFSGGNDIRLVFRNTSMPDGPHVLMIYPAEAGWLIQFDYVVLLPVNETKLGQTMQIPLAAGVLGLWKSEEPEPSILYVFTYSQSSRVIFSHKIFGNSALKKMMVSHWLVEDCRHNTSHNSHVGAIIGDVLVGVAAAAILYVGLFILRRSGKQRRLSTRGIALGDNLPDKPNPRLVELAQK
ncbi:hypothetical protein C8J57DRAFT_1255727 [Mycena rebaudengoi]|nr:hypothetical protein C8J57DRAFT_1255727 [Mycena rebaudengoi]